MKPALELALSIDVEEEGLFGGHYARSRVSVGNVAHLARLSPLLDDFGLPVTLLCTHAVFADAGARRNLDALRARHRVEIGAHLHHWNTPPADPARAHESAYQSPALVDDTLLRARLAALLQAGGDFSGETPTAFRMGKWDLHRRHWPLLAEAGVLVDASVRPLHRGRGGPDHFFAPADPYFVLTGGGAILEVPLTCTPLCGAVRLAGHTPAAASAQKWGALAVLPAYHPLWAMKAITRLHAARGGRVVSLTWHSSELMPGGAPHMPDAASVEAFLRKIRAYLDWLARFARITGGTFAELRAARLPARLSEVRGRGGDWRI